MAYSQSCEFLEGVLAYTVEAETPSSYVCPNSGVRIRPNTGAREAHPQDALCAGYGNQGKNRILVGFLGK